MLHQHLKPVTIEFHLIPDSFVLMSCLGAKESFVFKKKFIAVCHLYTCLFLCLRRAAPSGAYYIKTIPGKTSLIYCKMERTAECGDGGWTLAMKINGSKVRDILVPRLAQFCCDKATLTLE